MDELKACPFCGSEALLTTHLSIGRKDDGLMYVVLCQNEEAECNVRLLFNRTKTEAIKAWNTRTPELPNPCTVEQYEEITAEIFPKTALLWRQNRINRKWEVVDYLNKNIYANTFYSLMFIVQTGKPAPDRDWRPEC